MSEQSSAGGGTRTVWVVATGSFETTEVVAVIDNEEAAVETERLARRIELDVQPLRVRSTPLPVVERWYVEARLSLRPDEPDPVEVNESYDNRLADEENGETVELLRARPPAVKMGHIRGLWSCVVAEGCDRERAREAAVSAARRITAGATPDEHGEGRVTEHVVRVDLDGTIVDEQARDVSLRVCATHLVPVVRSDGTYAKPGVWAEGASVDRETALSAARAEATRMRERRRAQPDWQPATCSGCGEPLSWGDIEFVHALDKVGVWHTTCMMRAGR